MAISTVDLQTAAGEAAPSPKPVKRQRFRFVTNTKTLIGLIILGFYVLLAIFGPMLSPYDPDARGDELLSPPTGAHWFGTTHLGQGIFSQVLSGARGVVYVGLLAGLVATALAVIIGVSSGYLANTGGEALSALSDVFLVIPALPLIIIMASILPSVSNTTIGLVIGLTSWAWGARVLRAQTSPACPLCPAVRTER